MLDRRMSDWSYMNPAFPPLPEDSIHGQNSELEESDYDSVTGLWVILRPLGGFLHAPSGGGREAEGKGENKEGLGLILPRLKHLHLCRHSKKYGPQNASLYSQEGYSWSSRADQASLADWRQILQASSKTLETLVLEQRPGVVEILGERWAVSELMRDEKVGLGSKLLVGMLDEVLFEEDTFPALIHVYFYGIPVSESQGKPSEHLPGGRLMRLLEGRNIRCEARRGSWCYFEQHSRQTKWDRRVEESDEEEETYTDGSGNHMNGDTLLSSV